MTRTCFDASALAKTIVEEPGSDDANSAFAHAEEPIAPDWVVVELAQVLWKRSRRGEISGQQAVDRLQAIGRLSLELLPTLGQTLPALELALAHHHSVYDCLYVAVALSEDASLVTADVKLPNLARLLGVQVTLLGAGRRVR